MMSPPSAAAAAAALTPKPKPQSQKFVTRHASDFAFTPKMTGGTGDGRLVLEPQSASLSIGLFLDTRLPARRRPVQRKLPGSSMRRANRSGTDNSVRSGNTDDESSDSRSATSSQTHSRHNSMEGEMRPPAKQRFGAPAALTTSGLGGAMKPKPFEVSPAADDFPPLSGSSSSGRSGGAGVGSDGPPPLITAAEADAKWEEERKHIQPSPDLKPDGKSGIN